MPLDKEKAQDIIDDFVLSNEIEFETIEAENPALFDATLYALNFLSARFGTGQKMQIVEKPKVVQEVVQGGLPFKDGDMFKVPDEKSGQVYKLSDIRLKDKQVMVSWFSISEKVDKSYLDDIEDVSRRINDGNWVLVNTSQFELGQILYDENEEELFEISKITSNGITIKSAKGHIQFKATGVLEKGIGGRGYILASFKIGDVFTNGNKDIITIYQLSTKNQNDIILKWIRDGIMDIETRFWDTIETNIYDGAWIPLISQSQTNKPNNIKIGDLLFYPHVYKITEVIDVNNGVVKIMTSNNFKETLDFSRLKDQIDVGEKRILPFSINDTFVNPTGDFYKIMQLYPNNEKSLYVKVNENPNLDVFQWDLIEDWVNDGYWVRATKADADELKENLRQEALMKSTSGAKNNKQFIQNQPKAPKKRLTKLEKEIKELQDEIDGLLFLADEDDEAKADLEKKLIQIEALKSKKP
jgi:hypothetical protein